MASKEHLEILQRGVGVWNDWRLKHAHIIPDLIRANLKGAHLREATLVWADLSEADLSGANLIKANLIMAKLFQTNLSEADLSGADLKGADLNGANLKGANLNAANLTEANLHIADLTKASVAWTVFGDNDLSGVKGLDITVHKGPSTIGIGTLYRSNGKICEVFLREAGVPDDFIRYLPLLLAQPFQYYSCFLSYSSKDRLFCDRLYADLKAKGIRTWYFPEDAKWGETVWGEIDRSIKIYDKLVVICSKDSLQSGPVLREIERALRQEDHTGKNILFPIRIDDYLFNEWEHPRKADVLSKVVGDFRGWNRSAEKYGKTFKKLLAALQAGDTATASRTDK